MHPFIIDVTPLRTAYRAAIACIAAGLLFAIPTAGFGQQTELDQLLNTQNMISTKVRVAFTAPIDTRECEVGDKVEVVLRADIEHDDRVLVPAGSKLIGKIDGIVRSRAFAKSLLSKNERFRKHASIEMTFDKLVTPDNNHFEIRAKPARQNAVFTNGHACRSVRVSENGEIIRTENLDLRQLPEIELAIPSKYFESGRNEIKIQAGDEIVMHAAVPLGSTAVSGKVVSGARTEKRPE